ncbi:PAS domain S-box protein [Bdellovibrionota bacterium FG-1]
MPPKKIHLQRKPRPHRTVKRPEAIAEQMGSLEKFRRMATVIRDSNDAITFQDLDGNILAWNQGEEQIYGYSEAEALNKNIVDTVPTEYQEEARLFGLPKTRRIAAQSRNKTKT